MKNLFKSTIIAFLLLTIAMPALADDAELEIVMDEYEVTLGDTVGLEVVYKDTSGVEHDTTAEWSAEPAGLATIVGDSQLIADSVGKGLLIAQLGAFADTVDLKIKDPDDDQDGSSREQGILEIINGDVELVVGDSVQFFVVYKDTSGEEKDTTANWIVTPGNLGRFGGDGWFYAQRNGKGKIRAQLGRLRDEVEINIEKIDNNDPEDGLPRVEILTEKVNIKTGESVQLEAVYLNEVGDTVDVDLKWQVTPGFIGQVDPSGMFVSKYAGKGKITARYRQYSDHIEVEVEGEWNRGKGDKTGPYVDIITDRVELSPGDSVQLYAVFVDSSGTEIDTGLNWRVEPADLGVFSDSLNGLFFSDSTEGNGFIYAEYDGYEDRVKIKISSAPKGVCCKSPVVIIPDDTTVTLGTPVSYSVQVRVDSVLTDTTAVWSLHGNKIGTITEDGIVSTLMPGMAVIKATVGDSLVGTTTLTVIDPVEDGDSVNAVEISRVLPDGHILSPVCVNEGETFKIGGLPFPLNLFNGGCLHFPNGSLSDDITIHMMLPTLAAEDTTDSTGVVFSDSSVNAVQFVVMVKDSIVEPFYFDKPLNIILPYKPDLLNELGIKPDELGLYFFTERGDYTDAGIQDIVVDTVGNRIYAQVLHFSTLVVREQQMVTGADDMMFRGLPELFKLEQNYPNPFNPTTQIRFTLKQGADVSIKVYDVLGRQVRTLVDRRFQTGQHFTEWDGKNQTGKLTASGVYFYVLFIDGQRVAARRMLFLK